MALFNIQLPSTFLERLISQLERLNVSAERLLSHVGAPSLPTSGDALATGPAFVGEPLTDFELAVKEHAELTGREYVYDPDMRSL